MASGYEWGLQRDLWICIECEGLRGDIAMNILPVGPQLDLLLTHRACAVDLADCIIVSVLFTIPHNCIVNNHIFTLQSTQCTTVLQRAVDTTH